MTLHRRQFLKTAALFSAAAALDLPRLAGADAVAPSTSDSQREYYELRAYRLKGGASPSLLHGYLEKAFIPAMNVRGIRHVGVFVEPEPKDGPAVWVLIPHPSLESVAQVANWFPTDAGAEYQRTPTKESPAFDRIDGWLLWAFAGLPQLSVPALTRESKTRVFELRTYESYSEAKARNKVAMFNAGEIELMQTLGMSPVFYGQALVGRDLPHLTYMLCSPDRETAARNWSAFGKHPVWVRLKNDPQYADNVSKVTSRFLNPTAYSQL